MVLTSSARLSAKVTGGATLIIENWKFQNIANHNAIAIQFTPNSPAAQLIIRDSAFLNNGIASSTGAGLQVAPTGRGSTSVVLERVSFNDNVTVVALFGPVKATMVNSTACAKGIYPAYNPKSLDPCGDVCNKCQHGVTVTCTTSCKLRGTN